MNKRSRLKVYSRFRFYKNYLEAAIVEHPAIVVLVPSHQHVGQAALANLDEEESWVLQSWVGQLLEKIEQGSHPCCTKDDNSWAWKSVLIAIHSRGRAKSQCKACKAPQGQEGSEVAQIHSLSWSTGPFGLVHPLPPPQGSEQCQRQVIISIFFSSVVWISLICGVDVWMFVRFHFQWFHGIRSL